MDHNASERDRAVPIPRSFFERHLPRIRDLPALKLLLTVYRMTAELDPMAPFVSEEALFADRQLLDGIRLAGSSREPLDDLRHAIDVLVAHDAVVRVCVEEADSQTFWLMAREPDYQQLLNAYMRGERLFPYGRSHALAPRIVVERPNVFRLYEQNIGVVTPLIADQLVEAIELYPDGWIEEAINEAVSLNRRNWRYIQRILQRWATEGRGDETYRRNQGAAGFVQPEKYLRGKYSSLFRRGN
jgi:DNA replication protein